VEQTIDLGTFYIDYLGSISIPGRWEPDLPEMSGDFTYADFGRPISWSEGDSTMDDIGFALRGV